MLELIVTLLLALPVLALPVVIIVLVSRHSQRSSQQLFETWRAFGQEHGLTISRGDIASLPRLTGTWQGARITAQIVVRGFGKNAQNWTLVSAHPAAALPAGLHACPTVRSSGGTRVLSTNDVAIGDPEIDDAFWINAQDPAAVEALLRPPAARQALLRFGQAAGSLDEKLGFFVEQSGSLTYTAQLKAMLDAAAEASRALDEAHGVSRRADAL